MGEPGKEGDEEAGKGPRGVQTAACARGSPKHCSMIPLIKPGRAVQTNEATSHGGYVMSPARTLTMRRT